MVLSTLQAGTAREWLEHLPDEGLVLLYKHSPRCGVSLDAVDEVEAFAKQEPSLPVFQVDVIQQRALSQQIADALGIRHASPQVILLRGATPLWHTSHQRITIPTLRAQLLAARTDPAPGA
jgi:bacillithiol system protein YtxJ